MHRLSMDTQLSKTVGVAGGFTRVVFGSDKETLSRHLIYHFLFYLGGGRVISQYLEVGKVGQLGNQRLDQSFCCISTELLSNARPETDPSWP